MRPVTTGESSSATGAFSSASGVNSTASGTGSIASGANSSANGAFSTASGSNSVASGAGSIASGANSTAMGTGANATATNSVAIGANSITGARANTVSVGAVGNERQITNVAAGTSGTDAVNLNQLNAAITDFGDFASGISTRIDQLDHNVSRSGAMQSAMSMMSASAAGIRETNRLAVGAGFQGGQNALSIGFQRALSDTTTFTLGGAFSGGKSTVGIGYGVGW